MKTLTIENVEFISSDLPFCDATDLFFDLMASLGPAGGAWTAGGPGVTNKGDVIGMLAREVAGGRLTKYLARILAGTTMIVRGTEKGEKSFKVDLLNSREQLNLAFTGRSKFVFPAVKLALEVNYTGFLDGAKLVGFKIQMLSGSEVSGPNTSATDSDIE